ncbi:MULTISPECIES: Crp/Fnr family transcriptional regulator [unclassified Sedimentibacter]|uniref:Crp/Fnr family transcriptional regulator n=1 Tax=unclassified Sedimentibacter TaxID=2649220 RepID=UPI0027E1E2E2|nr:Crp/Fnr family transcriptional regulator [Sedimentibacter sp. MB35-C1]WMJ76969.1 Crp/Fnr family transcriptional regulator [Sedimentibacter sp. MB35-C1]
MKYENEVFHNKVVQLFLENNSNKWKNSSNELIFKKGEYITVPEKLENDVFIIKEGNASKFHIHIDGKECIIGLLCVGDFIGLMDVFTLKENREFVRALTDVTVVAVSKQEIRKFVEENPSVAMVLLNYISEKYLDMVEILEQIGYGTIKSRIVFLLKSLSDPQEDDNGWHPIPVSIAHKDIAGMIASTRETVTATLNKLSKEKVIRHHDGRLWIQMQEEN